MSFLRHGEIYRPMQKRERPANDRPRPHRYDEFPAGYSLAGCAPAEPTSASPAAVHTATKTLGSTIKMQRTANHLLTACLTQGDNLITICNSFQFPPSFQLRPSFGKLSAAKSVAFRVLLRASQASDVGSISIARSITARFS